MSKKLLEERKNTPEPDNREGILAYEIRKARIERLKEMDKEMKQQAAILEEKTKEEKQRSK